MLLHARNTRDNAGDVQEYCLCQIEGMTPSGTRDKSNEAVFDSPLNRLLINIKMYV
jgi:hypothetical protein